MTPPTSISLSHSVIFWSTLSTGRLPLAHQREAGQQAHEGREKLKERGRNRKDFHIRILLKLCFYRLFLTKTALPGAPRAECGSPVLWAAVPAWGAGRAG